MLNTLETKVQNQLKQKIKALNPKACKIAVGCSGGSDSTALLQLLLKYSEEFPELELAICHINYNLRGEENEVEEKFLSEIAQNHKIPFFFFHPEKTEKISNKIGVQAWARKERYDCFEKLLTQGWQIALAHTQDDLLENILMRISRGSSPIAAKGMSESHGPFWRPLLETSKKELLSWLEKNKLTWQEDSTNASSHYSRNKLRHEIIPALEKVYPTAKKHIIRFANQSQELAKYAREGLRKELKEYLTQSEAELSIDLRFFKTIGTSAVHLILADLIREFSQENYTPESKTLSALEKLIREAPEESPKCQLTTNIFYSTEENKLTFKKTQ